MLPRAKTYVVLAHGRTPTPDLAIELSAFVKKTLSAHEYPREVTFVTALPLTTTGKIIRRELRERAKSEDA